MRLTFVLVLLTVGTFAFACGSTTNESNGAGFGCCPDVQTGCTLLRYGMKSSADDQCIAGHDGMIPAPSQPGWTRGRDADGCPFWAPPANAIMIQCGIMTRSPESVPDAATDAATDDASDDASPDAPLDGSGD